MFLIHIQTFYLNIKQIFVAAINQLTVFKSQGQINTLSFTVCYKEGDMDMWGYTDSGTSNIMLTKIKTADLVIFQIFQLVSAESGRSHQMENAKITFIAEIISPTFV